MERPRVALRTRDVVLMHLGVLTVFAIIGLFTFWGVLAVFFYLIALLGTAVNRYRVRTDQARRRAALVQQLEDEEWALDELARRRKGE